MLYNYYERFYDMNNLNDIWDMFDKIVCLHFLPWTGDRFNYTKAELDRVGILNNPKFEWELTVPNKFFGYIRFPKGTKQTGHGTVTQANLPQTIHQYTLLKKLDIMGYERVLFLEDDIVFHKDLNFIKSVIDKTPEDADFANYDPFRRAGWLGAGKGYWGHYYDLSGNEVQMNDVVPDTFLRYNSVVYNTDCILMSHKGIHQFVENQERNICPGDWYTWKDTQGLNTYCVSQGNNICIQNKSLDTKINDGYASTFEQVYKGLDLNDYNLPSKDVFD